MQVLPPTDASRAPAIDSPTLAPSTVYSDSADYDHAGNVKSYNDQVMGKWTFTYDDLNRLASGTPSTGVYSGQNQQLCLDYDSFGNRTQSDLQTTACKPGTDPATATYYTNNQLKTTAAGVFSYDAAGDVTFDGNNDYAYDAEGRVCSMQTSPYSGGIQAYGYFYDAEGRRVAKGTVTPVPLGQAPSCNLSTNGFVLTESYTLGQGGERLTTLAWTGQTSTWQNTSVYAGGALIATYDAGSSGAAADAGTAGGLHFQLTDPLGTRRVQANSAGEAELDCQSLPFGDQLSCFPDPNAPDNDQDEDATGILTGIHFTGKERDTESGLDYFGARYYASNMGRFLSPDWSGAGDPVPYASLDNPQTLNLYSYVQNNPLSRTDPFGHADDPCKGIPNCVSVTAKPDDGPPLTTLAMAFGHHFVDQAVVAENKAGDSLAGQFFRRWFTGGPLKNPGVHTGFPTPARLSQQQIRDIIQKVKDLNGGKNMSEWGWKEIREAVEEVRSAGGDTGQFLSDIAAENPTFRTVSQDVGDIEAAAQAAYEASKGFVSNAAGAVESTCESEPNCGLPPP